MKLYTHCTSCKRQIPIKSSASTRPDLQMEKGSDFKVYCSCGSEETKHVNDITAEKSNSVMIIGVAIGIVVSAILLFNYGIIGTLGLSIPIIFWRQQMSAIKALIVLRLGEGDC